MEILVGRVQGDRQSPGEGQLPPQGRLTVVSSRMPYSPQACLAGQKQGVGSGGRAALGLLECTLHH